MASRVRPRSLRPTPPKLRLGSKSTIERALRMSVYDRAGGCCDRCGRAVPKDDWECHHRKLRSQGGQDSMFNLVCLCHEDHARIHRAVQWSYENGWLVRSFDDPALVPVRRGLGREFPTPDGWVSAVEP